MKSRPPSCFCKRYDSSIILNPFENETTKKTDPIKDPCFFESVYEACCGQEKLDLHGKLVTRLIGRKLKAWDIPALVIFLKNNQNVTRVNLSYNNLTDAGFKTLLDYSTSYKNLCDLPIQCNGITEGGIDYLLEIGDQVQIRSLKLKGNKIGVEGSKKLALFLLKNSYILELDAGQIGQTASSLMYFVVALTSVQVPYNSTLKALDISRPNPGCMQQFDSKHFADVIGRMLKYNTSLKQLHLQKYGFSCHDIEGMLLNGSENKTLLMLDLRCNNIGDHGAEYLSLWLKKRPALRTLILGGNIITDHGARDLSRGLPFSRITRLDVSYNRMTDDGVTSILNSAKKVPVMRSLKIFGNSIGHPSAKIVQRMLMSEVLVQEGLDVRPYRLDQQWCFAKYSGDTSRNKCYDVPRSRIRRRVHIRRQYYKYVYFGDVAEKTEAADPDHPRRDESPEYICGSSIESACECEPEDSSSSVSETKSSTNSYMGLCTEIVQPVLNRVNSKTREMILRWVNIDEDVLEQDLKASTDKERSEEPKSSSESSVSCKCSWSSLTIPRILKYLEGMPVDVILLEEQTEPDDSGQAPVQRAGSGSLLQYCTNVL